MFRNYLTVAIRNLIRHKGYSAINIVGLSIGLAGCLLVSCYVIGELSFEDCHLNADRIYRVQGTFDTGGGTLTMARAVGPLAPVLEAEFPEVEAAVRFRQLWTINVQANRFDTAEAYAFCAGSELLQMFTLPLLAGHPATALNDPYSVIISEDLAARHFAATDPVGARLTIMDTVPCTVTGVMRNIPANTQLHCDLIVSYATLEHVGRDVSSWDAIGEDYVYVLLAPGADPGAVNNKLPDILARNLDAETAGSFNLSLFPLKDIYLHSEMSWELQPSGDLNYVYLFAGVALLLLFMACVNFVNLTTARTAHRLREIGVRKMLGAFRRQLLSQFVSESLLISSLAMVLGLALFEAARPPLESFLGRPLAMEPGLNPQFILLVLGLVLVVGIVAGAYPGILLSRLRVIGVLGPVLLRLGSRTLLRRVLLVFQFSLAAAMLFTLLAWYRQTDYMMTKDLGFDPNDVVVFKIEGEGAPQKCQRLKQELLRLGGIESATMTAISPGEPQMWLTMVHRADQPEAQPAFVQLVVGDYDFLSTFDIELAAGRFFSEDVALDKAQSILINESAVELFELDEPIGHQFVRGDQTLTVVGVVRDYHQLPVNNPNGIMPTVLMLGEKQYSAVAVRLASHDGSADLASLQQTWERVLPEAPFEYVFLSDEISDSYGSEQRLSVAFVVFAILAGLIALLGIVGLASFAAERRTKEVGVRKALGASFPGLVGLLTREFVLLSVISSGVGLPLGGYLASVWWMNRFPFQADLGVGLYVATALVVLLVTLMGAGFQSAKAARANPVEALRYE